MDVVSAAAVAATTSPLFTITDTDSTLSIILKLTFLVVLRYIVPAVLSYIAEVKSDFLRAALFQAAEGAIHIVEEKVASGELAAKGEDKFNHAVKLFQEKFPIAKRFDEDMVRIALKAAVGKLEGVGATAKKP